MTIEGTSTASDRATTVRRTLDGDPVADVEAYLRLGGGDALRRAREIGRDAVIDAIERSGLRGRGGAGFPTGRKLRAVADAYDAAGAGAVHHVIVNAAEGEPGTFKDRAILRHDPYRVVEGACVVAEALGARDVIVATKAAFTHELERLDAAVRELRDAGVTGDVTVRVVEGPSEYLYGEETGLLEVLDGRPPFPRLAPPYRRGILDAGAPSASGATWTDGPAVLVSNVETFAAIPGIVRDGPAAFRSCGTEASPGTIVCTVTGDTLRHGVGEVPMGTTVREVIELVGGGVPAPHRVVAVLCGVSGPPLDAASLDTPLTYEAMSGIGTGLGSAGRRWRGSSAPTVCVVWPTCTSPPSWPSTCRPRPRRCWSRGGRTTATGRAPWWPGTPGPPGSSCPRPSRPGWPAPASTCSTPGCSPPPVWPTWSPPGVTWTWA